MDPFAPDSDGDEDHPLSRSEANAAPNGRSSHAGQNSYTIPPRSTAIDAAIDDDDEEGPPPSILLSVHDHDESKTPVPRQATLRSAEIADDRQAGPSRPTESVRLGTLSNKSHTASFYRDDDGNAPFADDVAEDAEDEEAGLIGQKASSSSSSSSSRRKKKSKGLLHDFARRVKRKAHQIQAEDGLLGRQSGPKIASKGLSPKDRALWEWGTLENLDDFLQEVYAYYVGRGLFCIALTKGLNLLTIAFVIGFSTFLVGCVDYSKIQHDSKLSDIVIDQCISRPSGASFVVFAAFIIFYGWQMLHFALGYPRLVSMSHFYSHLLNIPDADVQSIPWHEVVTRLSHLRQSYPNTSISSSRDGVVQSKLDAHDVANRIMRQENYLVALFNKDVLNIRIPFPGLQSQHPELTKMLEWNLAFCLLGYLFDSKGQIRRQFLTDQHRLDLIEGLQRRFIFMAVINAIFAPFIILYLLFYSFFRYFEEYHKNPSTLGSRQYTQFARWKFREFNELPHLFKRRCHNSYPFAQRYIDQFPKEKVAIIAKFISFVAGSFTAVLLLASVIDPDLFVHFDITHQRNVLFYIGVFGAITAMARGMVPDDQVVFEPDILLRGVIEHTHYCPEQWKGRFHSAEVHAEFGSMYKLKIYIFFNEILSVLFTPFILWKSLPTSAPAIIDFFREFTVHVDGLGYICSFAVFDFRRHGNVKFGAPEGIRDERYSSKEGKMEQSLLGFRAANPTWQPSDPSATLFLSRLAANTPLSPPPPPQPRSRATSGQGALAPLSHTNRGFGGGGNAHNFTPANSTLAQKSQLYTDAFERSISLATKPSNALALQASAVKTGLRSVATKTLQAVSECRDQDGDKEEEEGMDTIDEDLDPNSQSAYDDAKLNREGRNTHSEDGNSHDQVDLRGLLQHLGSQW